LGTKDIVITGQPVAIDVASVKVTSTGDASTITTNKGTLQMVATILPTNALIKSVLWSVDDASIATISATGLLTAVNNGTVIVKASSNAESGIFNTKSIVISNQIIIPDTIFVMGSDGVNGITTNFGTLQLFATVSPTYAEPDVIWSVAKEDSAMATISKTGLLSAWADGAVTVIATSTYDVTKNGETEITITNQTGAPSIIEVTGANNFTEITTSFGTLQMFATVSPTYAETAVNWSIAEGDSIHASISNTGLLTAKSNGSVTVIATSTADNNIKGEAVIGISNQFTAVSSLRFHR